VGRFATDLAEDTVKSEKGKAKRRVRKWLALSLFAFLFSLLLAACGSDSVGPAPRTRAYRMGFSNFPPKPDINVALQALDLWVPRADAAIISGELPWAALLADSTPEEIITADLLAQANFFRAHHLDLVITLDVTDGLNRSAESPALAALGRSITDTGIQRLYRRYVSAIDSMLHPSYLALAMETNLIRMGSADSVYRAVVAMTNAAAADRAAVHSTTKLMVTVQVEAAWGRFTSNQFVGIAQDRTDFPFGQALGLSSYPYLGGFNDPSEVPPDYYSRLVLDQPVPVLVTEGGWTSASFGAVVSSPFKQAAWIHREGELLDAAHAVAFFQLDFTDLALSFFPPIADSGSLPYFAHLGLVDSALTPKVALASWDTLFALPRSRP